MARIGTFGMVIALLLWAALAACGQTAPAAPPASAPGEVQETTPELPAATPSQPPAHPLPLATMPPSPGSQPAPKSSLLGLRPSSVAVVHRVLTDWPEGRISTAHHAGEWGYEEGFLLDGIAALWRQTGDPELFQYLQATVDRSVDKDGVIHLNDGQPFTGDAHALDDIAMGRSVLLLYRVTQQPRYYAAAKFLHDQMAQQPRNASGGYWHNQLDANQMWLGDAYMAEPFLEYYGHSFHQPAEMDAAASQLLLIDAKLREKQGGLLRHGYDATLQAEWASKTTGQSAAVPARAVGWFAMALVDVLDRMPTSDPQRAALEAVARRVLQAVVRTQDTDTGLWWQVIDKPAQKGNFLESSASA